MDDLLERLIPKIGDRVGRYDIVAELGRGGFGVVYRAKQAGLEADVAIKLMLPQVSPQAQRFQLYERFEQEARVLKRLEHPNTVGVRDYGRTGEGLPYLVLEFIRGQTLDKLCRAEGLPAHRIVRIGQQVLGSLAEAHHHGIIHRDLKPENIMVRDIPGNPDSVKVLDFGIAKLLNETTDVRTMTGAALGTPWYMAPEQARGLKGSDGRLDLYAFGLILAECITGRRVVTAELPMAAAFTQASDRPLEFEADVMVSPLFPVIWRATAKDPVARYPSAEAMRNALEEVGRDLAHQAPPVDEAYAYVHPAPIHPPPATAPAQLATPIPARAAVANRPAVPAPSEAVDAKVAPVRRRRAGLWVGAALVLAGATGALFLASGGADDPPPNAPVATASNPELGLDAERSAATPADNRDTDAPEQPEAASGAEDGDSDEGLVRARETGVLIETSIPGAEVRVDGALSGTTGEDGTLRLDRLSPGTRQIRVGLAGWIWAQERVLVREGVLLPVAMALWPERVTATDGSMLVFVEDERPFYIAHQPVSAIQLLACTSDTACGAALEGEYRTHDDSERCHLADSEYVYANCISQRGANAYCAHHGLRLPTDVEWDAAAPYVAGNRSGNALWLWTATTAADLDRHIVRGGPPDLEGPDEIDPAARRAVVRSVATAPYVGVICAADAEAGRRMAVR